MSIKNEIPVLQKRDGSFLLKFIFFEVIAYKPATHVKKG